MKIGPVPNPLSPDCLPVILDVDDQWLAEQLAAHPDKDAADIIWTEIREEIAKALNARVLQMAPPGDLTP